MSIAVASVVLLVAGAMILNSLNFFNTTVYSDLDKRCVDSLISFVREEIVYASDVRILPDDSPDKPNSDTIGTEWHCFYVNNGRLYHDNVYYFNYGFYNNKKIEISLKGNYENGSRVDFNYQLIENDNQIAYQSHDTILFLNLFTDEEIKSKGWFATDAAVTLSQDKGNGYKIYYNNSIKKSNEGVENKKTGTVEDIQYLLSSKNYRGVYLSGDNYNYQNGEIVWHDGYWWERVAYNDNREPGKAFGWKRLSKEYCNPYLTGKYKSYSSYEEGDIVCDEKSIYYLANTTILQTDGSWNALNDQNAWKKLGMLSDSFTDSSGKVWKVSEFLKQYTYPKKISTYPIDNIVAKYWPINYSFKNIKKDGFEEFNPNDIVKKKNKADSSFYDLYIKKGRFDLNVGPGWQEENNYISGAESGWVKIDISYDVDSSYVIGDVVRSTSTGNNLWVQANQNIFKRINPLDDISNGSVFWKKYSNES